MVARFMIGSGGIFRVIGFLAATPMQLLGGLLVLGILAWRAAPSS